MSGFLVSRELLYVSSFQTLSKKRHVHLTKVHRMEAWTLSHFQVHSLCIASQWASCCAV